MKRTILLGLCSLLMGLALNAETTRIYCKMSQSWWKTDGAAVGAHVWGTGGSTTWPGSRMTAVYGETDLWYTDVDLAKYQSIIFVRVNGSGAVTDWGAKTKDLTLPTDGKNLFTITTSSAVWGDPGCDGEWSIYSGGSGATPVYHIAGEGFPGLSWNEGSHVQLTDNQIAFTNLPAGTYKFKITDGTWSYNLGYGAVDASCSTAGYSDDADGNVVIVLLSTGDITIRVADAKICVTIVGETQQLYSSAVPSQCTDVMMQAFYNESYLVNNSDVGTNLYGDTKWTTLLSSANEIGDYFDLVWLPPSAMGDGMGYHPKQYSNQNSNWGTRAELEALISAFHAKGTKVIADIVINHCAGWSSWCDFPAMDFGTYGVFYPDASYIASTDEVNLNPDAGDCYGKATGPQDDGWGDWYGNWDGARDWAHDAVKVQEMFKAYLLWMRNVMKYDGFRYDKGDGFNNWHHDNYNKASNPYIAFMELWSGNDQIIAGIDQANKNVMALDFQTKYSAFDGIAGFDYSKCQGSGLLGRGYNKYAVTFIDSHDWFLRGNGGEFGGNGKSLTEELKDRLLQANAFLLSMPGVPCVFYPHWYKYKEALKPMIDARHAAGVHNESAVSDEYAEAGGYQATIRGKYGYLILQLGNKTTHTNTGSYSWLADYTLMASGPGYAMWVNVTNPPLPTDIEDVSEDLTRETKGEKFIQDGKLYIRYEGKTYDVFGTLVK